MTTQLLTTTLVVSTLGGVAALLAFVALASLVRLVATDVWDEARRATGRWSRRRRGHRTRPDAPTIHAAPLGQHLAAYHATHRAG